MEMQEVRRVLVRIEALEEERDRHARERKRCQDDIDLLLAQMRKRVLHPEEPELPFPKDAKPRAVPVKGEVTK